MSRLRRFTLLILVVFLFAEVTALAQRGRGGSRGGARSSVSRSSSVSRNAGRNVNRDVNRNVNRDVNRDIDRDFDRNIDIDRDFDVDVDWDNRYGCCHGWGAAAVATTAAVATAAAIGNTVYALPPSCTVVVVDGFTYHQCGSDWYQPVITGSSTSFVVVNSPQ
jgi:hypothetical protein